MKVLALCSILICGLSAQAAIPSRSGIVGGGEVEPHALPWVVELMYEGKKPFCGGTILCPKYIITAGHCTWFRKESRPFLPEEVQVVAGAHDLTLDEPSKTYHKVKALHKHPDYAGIMGRMDYGIIKLADPIALRPEARAPFLPDGSESFETVPRFIASGWGMVGEGTDGSNVLRSVTVPWVPNRICKYSYYHKKDVICAGDWKTGDIGACKGDSGSPLSFLDPNTDQVKVVGLTSGGHGVCVGPHSPGVYSDIAKQLDWVKSIIGECNQETCDRGWCTRKDDLNPWTIKEFSRVTPHLTAE